MKAVVHNFLGTFASRNSDHSGYWIFGMIVGDLIDHQVDLLGEELAGNDALAATGQVARNRFRQQVMKSGLAISCVREAWVELHRSPRSATVSVNGHAATAHELTLTVRVVSDLGRTYERTQSIFAAAHDSSTELRSARADS